MLSLLLLCLLVQTGASSNTTSDLYLMFLATCADGAGGPDCVNDTRSAVQLAVDHVNTNSDLNRQGYTLVLTEKISMCDHKGAQGVFYQSLFNEPNEVAIIGAGCSVSTVAVAEVAQYYYIPMMSYASTSVELSARRDFPNFFRTVPSDMSLMQGVARFVATYPEWEQVVIITQDEEQYKLQTNILVDELVAINVTINATVLLPANLDRSSPGPLFPPDQRIFVLNMEPSRAQYTLCEAIKMQFIKYEYVWILQGWYMDRWWTLRDPMLDVGCNATSLEEFLFQQRAIALSYFPPNFDQIVPDNSTGIILDNFTESIASPSARYAYDAVLALAIGIADALSGLGSLQIDDFVPVNLTHPEIGQLLINHLNQLKGFQGVSGFVELENGTRVIDNITVLQYRGDNGAVNLTTVGVISLVNEDATVDFTENESRDQLWLNGIPSDGQPITEERFPYLWLTISSYVFATIVIIGALVSIVFTFIFKNRKLVRLTSPNMNLIIALGVIVFNSGVYLFTYPPISNDVLEVFCALRAWVVSIGISLCFGTVNAKMWRIYYIFHNPNPSQKKRPLKDWHLLLIVLGFVALDVILLTFVSAFDTARLIPDMVPDVEHSPSVNDKGITVFYFVTLCESPRRLIWLAVLFGYKAVIQAIGLFLALRIRNIKIKVLNDSKEIAATLYLTSAILAVVIVVSIALSNNLNVYTASYCYGIPLSTGVVLIVVFFTKMVKLYRDPWGENIFTHSPPSGNFSSSPAMVGNTVTLGSDGSEDRVHILERQVHDLKRQLYRTRAHEKDPQDKNGSPANVKANVHVLLAEPDSGEHSDNNTIENGFELATAQDVEPNGKINGNGITQETTDSV